MDNPTLKLEAESTLCFRFFPLFVGLAFIQVLAPLREEPWVASCRVVLKILETNMEIDNVPVLSGTWALAVRILQGKPSRRTLLP
jgi:hypothetical protein